MTKSFNFPELYTLKLTTDYIEGSVTFEGITFHLFKVYTQELALDYSSLIAVQPNPLDEWSEYGYCKDFINADLFTSAEKEQVRAYLERFDPKGTLRVEHFNDFPIRDHQSVGATFMGSSADIYPFGKSKGFDCPVNFKGYFDRSTATRRVGVATLTCNPDGSVDFPTLTSLTMSGSDLDRIQAGRDQAAQSGEAQTVMLERTLSNSEAKLWNLRY